MGAIEPDPKGQVIELVIRPRSGAAPSGTIPWAVVRIKERLSCPPANALNLLRAARLPGFDGPRELSPAQWEQLQYRHERYLAELREGLPHASLFIGRKVIHSHAIKIPEEEFDYWLERQPQQVPNINFPSGSATGPMEPSDGTALTAHPQGSKNKRRGPKPGAVDRWSAADRALYPELEALMQSERMSLTAATQRLADEGKIAKEASSITTKESLATRLRRRFRQKNSIPLDPTNSN